MIECVEILNNAIESIDEVSVLYYQQNTQEGHTKYQDTLTHITSAIDSIFKYKNEIRGLGNYESIIISILYNAMNAMEINDTILLSDILRYELKEELQNAIKLFD